VSFVMFDIYTTQPQVLGDLDAEALASALVRNGLAGLAGRIRYGLANDTLVEIDPTEHGFLVEALDAAAQASAARSARAETLAQNLRARMAGIEAVVAGQVASRSGRLDKIGRE
jgi:hypothetical protein